MTASSGQMANRITRTTSYVCRSCRAKQPAAQSRLPALISTDHLKKQIQPHWSQVRAVSTRVAPKIPQRPAQRSSKPPPSEQATRSVKPSQPRLVPATTSSIASNTSGPAQILRSIRKEVNAVAASSTIPEQAQVLEILDQSYRLANLLLFGQSTAPEEQEATGADNDNASLISDLEETSNSASRSTTTSPAPIKLPASHREQLATETCQTIYDLLKDPKVAIDEPVLSIYVRIVCQLGEAQYLPEIFFLYANKPCPVPDNKGISYKSPSPNAAKNAIPQNLSDVALDTAILQRDLPLAIAIIDNTVATRAFRINKFLRKASLPLGFAASTPLAVYAAADWVANWQNTLDPQMAKAMTIMGSMAYVGTLGTIGFVALTTYNDHHDRVVWTPGTPLRQRWMREEERMYLDRIATAWGFQRRGRRGEEMGEEWEALREELAIRSMILDKSDLLEGMQ